MFSDYLKKIDKLPSKTLLAISAVLVFLCQLLAMVLVMDGPAEKSQARDTQSGAARMVIADCSENYSGAVRSRCIERMQAHLAAKPAEGPGADAQAPTRVSARQGGTPVSGINGFFKAAFETRR